jgi:site-specific DNA recombinase
MTGALVYLRVSTKEQAEGFSLDAQREACVRFIVVRGWLLADVYSDRGESARTANRPMFQEMLERVVADPTISYVVVHKLDRLARNVQDHVVGRAHLRKHGVTLVSVSEGVDESPSGQLVENTMASIAAFYSANLGQETKKRMSQKARSGGWPHKAPIGYRNVRQDGLRRAVAQIVHDPVQAPLVREALEVFGAGQRSIRQLRDLMADQGLRTTLGAIPAVSQMHRLLTNKLYMGVVSWHGEEHQGDYEPIVDLELFETVQAVIRKHQGGVVRERRHHHYLRGKLICAKCDSRWTDMQVNRQHDGLATSCLQRRPPSAASPSSRPSGSAFSGSTSPAAWR